jgi:small-conductance mechanosensitive channel
VPAFNELAKRLTSVPLALVALALPAAAQESPIAPAPTDVTRTEAPQPRIGVARTVTDAQIAERLQRILEATGWFTNVAVRVDNGVVFLEGATDDGEHKDWAADLATRTEEVVAVVNEIEVLANPWDFSPAVEQMRELGDATVRRTPLLALGHALVVASWFLARVAVRGATSLLGRRVGNPLLRDVAARVTAVPVFLLGLYLALSITGLTGLAVTVIGGTGLLGLVIGFAFRDIAENFLASVLISVRRPFATNDLIQVAGHQGFVQSVNMRSTLLMTLDGNHVQIPNATIYKETITNFTANPIARYDFTVGIGYEDSVAQAQEVALAVLNEHPAVIDDPEPLVLVETLGAATVNLRVYFWVDISKYSQQKVRSAVIRLTKRAFVRAGVSMPDEAREVVFPKGVPVQLLSGGETESATLDAARARRPAGDAKTDGRPEAPATAGESDASASTAEGGLVSDAAEIKRQAAEARAPEGGANLLSS